MVQGRICMFTHSMTRADYNKACLSYIEEAEFGSGEFQHFSDDTPIEDVMYPGIKDINGTLSKLGCYSENFQDFTYVGIRYGKIFHADKINDFDEIED